MLEKVVKILGWVVLGAAAVISVLFFLLPGEAPEMQAAMDALDGATGAEKIEGVDAAATNWGGFIMYACEILALLCAAMFVVFEIGGVIVDGIASPKSLIKPAIAIVAIVVVVIISWALADGIAPNTIGIQKAGYTPGDAYGDIKLAEAGLWMTYIAGAAAILALVYGAVSRLWK